MSRVKEMKARIAVQYTTFVSLDNVILSLKLHDKKCICTFHQFNVKYEATL